MINILGINISELNKNEVLEKIKLYLENDTPHYVITPNPEIILKAIGKDEEYFHVLNRADISVADGFGLKLAAWFKFRNLPRITGAGLLLDLFEILNKESRKVLVLNWEGGLSTSQEIRSVIKKRFDKINLKVVDSDKFAKDLDYDDLKQFRADFLFVNFGAPYQEKFIFHNLEKIPGLRCAIGIGGAFDFLTGKIKRAPKIMRLLGIEWLWRLKQQPKRFKRIMNATVVFFYKFLVWNFITPFFYRPNVVCMVYKKEKGRYKILLVKRADLADHYQLPQGGTDGESLEEAGIRELNEEMNTGKFVFKKSFKNLHKYKFNQTLNIYNVTSTCITGYKGQKQGLIIAEFVGNDKDIKINYFEHSEWLWVDIDSLLDSVHDYRKKAVKKFIEKFKEVKVDL